MSCCALQNLFASIFRLPFSVDYVEEITAQVVGVEDTFAFFRYCFHEEVEYYVTTVGDLEHDLWDHAEEAPVDNEETLLTK